MRGPHRCGQPQEPRTLIPRSLQWSALPLCPGRGLTSAHAPRSAEVEVSSIPASAGGCPQERGPEPRASLEDALREGGGILEPAGQPIFELLETEIAILKN